MIRPTFRTKHTFITAGKNIFTITTSPDHANIRLRFQIIKFLIQWFISKLHIKSKFSKQIITSETFTKIALLEPLKSFIFF